MNNQKLTILYQRLSKDDANPTDGASLSIQNQREMLIKYAEQNGYTPYVCLCDDGRTGTNFQRPGWSELMELVEADKVGAIILKSLDRMGRNYLEAGMLREMFAEKGIRLIAINDGVDTFDHPDDFIPFREIMAEYYARDTSRKIKSVLKNKERDGKPLSTNAIYGFIKAPGEKNAWLIDEPAAEIVRRIFFLTVEGKGPYQIARILYEDNVERPSYYLATRGRGSNQSDYDSENPYSWNGRTIIEMIAKPEYAGHTVNFRTNKQSFKSKKKTMLDPSEWHVFENTHPAIVPQETWDLAQKCRETVRRTNDKNEPNPYTGLLFCHECKRKMYYHGTRKSRQYLTKTKGVCTYATAEYYRCSSQSLSRQKFYSACTAHRITVSDVREIIQTVLKRTAGYVRDYEAEFVAKVREASELRQGETVKSYKKTIAKNERRVAELDKLITGLYESMIKELINEERFTLMSANYEREQAELKEQNVTLQSELDAFENDSANADKFVALVRRFTDFEEITNSMVLELVDRIEVYEGEYPDADPATGYKSTRTQKVDVYLKYIGNFDAPEPADPRTESEIEAARIEEEKLNKRRAANCRYARRKREEKKAAQVVAV
ncbi:MAG: recombinase family protein [Clostridiales Family XIII bacterium]|nr:recombinase family protein [Clostridiales Family XIII bacterium]